MTSTSTSTTHNVSVDETSVNAQKEHINVDRSGPLTPVQNLIGEFQGVKITKGNGRERKKTLQDVGEQKDAREKLHTLKKHTATQNHLPPKDPRNQT